jgi:hypothetical protein
MPYTGLWVKKGFTYITGPAQTSLTMTIRNNAPGGGGNDWAIDDISLATCSPTLNLVPSGGVNVCYGNQIDMFTTVRCFSPNYIYWTWERSTNGGVSWTNTGVSGTGSPTLVGGEWQYIASFPSFLGDSSVHNNMFRIRVASTAANLSDPGCSYTASNTIRVWVNNCGQLLKTKLLDFIGKSLNAFAKLEWISDIEGKDVLYELQRSEDRQSFTTITRVNGKNLNGKKYQFDDPKAMTGTTYYRLKISEGDNSYFSKMVVLNYKTNSLQVQSIVNPFESVIKLELVSTRAQKIKLQLIDLYGKLVHEDNYSINEGFNQINFAEMKQIAVGTYTLIIRAESGNLYKKIVKAG